MMKLILLSGLCVFGYQAYADEAVVIDSQSVGQPPASAGAASAVTPDTTADANATNKALFLKGGKMSPREKAAVAKAQLGDENLQAGTTYLAAYRARAGVVGLPSGVLYTVKRAGNGKTPTDNSTIRCRYTGKLIDGRIIDKSDTKKPASIKVGGLIEGLKEAVELMPTGSKWEIVVPPQRAYGAFGNRGIGPNAVLVYEMEVLGIK
jgi:FKBP-type peptidyl-prolyl cis-trans isomerase FkpA